MRSTPFISVPDIDAASQLDLALGLAPEPGPLPPLHAPADRELFARFGAWEARRYATDDERFAYFAARGFLHVQLWHPARRVSVLTPSRFTAGHFEIARGARRARACTWPGVLAQLPDHGLPGSVEVAALALSLFRGSRVS